MRRFLVKALFTFVVLAMLAPSVFAQAPAPKVTITGLFDQITSGGRNFYDGDLTRGSDREWYARTRFRPDFTFEVGRVKAVLGLEIDLMYGQAGANDGGFPGNNSSTNSGCKVNSNGCLDLNTDVGGMIEIKWIYTEFPLTGKDSLLPFIPVETMARAGGQPFGRLANYKIVYANGDFAGVSAVTTFTPTLTTNLAYAIIEDELAGGNRGLGVAKVTRGEDYALIVSPEITPYKGLDLKPLFSWFHADGVTASGSRHHVVNRRFAGGANTTTNSGASLGGGNAAGDPTFHEDRYTIGFDARWRSGPFGFEPTVYYQWGQRDHMAVRTDGSVGKVEADMSSWIVDLIGSFATGPLLLEARVAYSPGNKARDNLARSVRYFQPLDEDGNYWNGWAALLANGGIDYFNSNLLTNMGRHIGYDRYGRAALGFKATYSITPALALYAWVSPNWTAEKVDTDTGAAPGTGASAVSRTTLDDQSWVEGDSRYIGTEVDLGLTWRFAPNVAFDLQGAYLFAGDALGTAEVLSGVHTRREPKDAYMVAARVRFAF
ncbi:MAG: hypothetical protein DMD99_11770 [Candidatus Rokuibacteriota bacterium]|nr:MAG: hypothetical protein DMD99_11770 [Candidatus Rokubacteria bacterium]